jgi:hypothetical protein
MRKYQNSGTRFTSYDRKKHLSSKSIDESTNLSTDIYSNLFARLMKMEKIEKETGDFGS